MVDRKARWDRSKGRPEPIGALNRIEEIESGEPLVDLRIAAPSLVMAREVVIPYARKTVADMADRAALSLPSGFKLGLIEAWRPFARQQRIYDFIYRSAKEAFPDRSHASLRRTACRWAAPTDQKAPPGHCTGAALDVWLLDESSEPVDVWSPYSDRYKAAPTYVKGLATEAQRNRQILVDVMLAAGFSNCRDEWWHYSYGDAGWAVRTASPSCIYGLVDLPSELYEREEALWLEMLKTRSNPFTT